MTPELCSPACTLMTTLCLAMRHMSSKRVLISLRMRSPVWVTTQ